jgi:cytochrome P450
LVSRIAGSDTTSSTLTFTMLLLLNNQEKLNNLVAEIDASFPAKCDSITFANTQDLPYLNAVINESMRVMPIVIAGQLTTHVL